MKLKNYVITSARCPKHVSAGTRDGDVMNTAAEPTAMAITSIKEWMRKRSFAAASANLEATHE